jgi:hypothetical protein
MKYRSKVNNRSYDRHITSWAVILVVQHLGFQYCRISVDDYIHKTLRKILNIVLFTLDVLHDHNML